MTGDHSYPDNLDLNTAKSPNTGANVFSFSVATGTLGFLVASANQGSVSGVAGFFIGFSLSFVPLTVAVIVEAMVGGNSKGKGGGQSGTYEAIHDYAAEISQYESSLNALQEAMGEREESSKPHGLGYMEGVNPKEIRWRQATYMNDPRGGILVTRPSGTLGDMYTGMHREGIKYILMGKGTSSLICPRCSANLKVEIEPESRDPRDLSSGLDRGETR